METARCGSVVVDMTRRRQVGAVDNIWLNMDRPNNLMVIDAVMWFDGAVDWDQFAVVVRRRIVDRYPVFRQRLASEWISLGTQHWEDDPDFALANHLHHLTLPEPGDQAALQQLVEDRMKVPLDRGHALWELLMVDGFRGGSAIVARFHHALADGIALAEVLLCLTDVTPDAPDEELPADRPETPPSSRLTLPFPGLGTTGRLASAVARRARPSLVTDALILAQQTAHIADKLLLSSLPRSPLAGNPGIDKRAVWSQARPIDEVKRIARLADATVNDVMVAAVSGAISQYVLEQGGEPRDLTTMVPINLRPAGEPLPAELGNRFALAMLPLPSATREPLERLAEAKRRMDSIKSSPEALMTFGLINAIGFTHPRVETQLVNFFSNKAIGVTTNVMGPMTGRYVAGARIAGILGWVPGSGRQTLGVCIFSYNRAVRVGFKADSLVVAKPELLVESFEQELDDLARMSRAL